MVCSGQVLPQSVAVLIGGLTERLSTAVGTGLAGLPAAARRRLVRRGRLARLSGLAALRVVMHVLSHTPLYLSN